MVKTIFSSFSKGFFYTIGKIIAFFFIGVVLYTLISKLPTNDENDHISAFPLYRSIWRGENEK